MRAGSPPMPRPSADVEQKRVELGGVAGIEVTIAGNETDPMILYFHSGVYVIGSAAATVPLVADLVRRTGVNAITLDYPLAPQHPYPGALHHPPAGYQGLLAHGLDPGQI